VGSWATNAVPSTSIRLNMSWEIRPKKGGCSLQALSIYNICKAFQGETDRSVLEDLKKNHFTVRSCRKLHMLNNFMFLIL
jgi:hypothetical protein